MSFLGPCEVTFFKTNTIHWGKPQRAGQQGQPQAMKTWKSYPSGKELGTRISEKKAPRDRLHDG